MTDPSHLQRTVRTAMARMGLRARLVDHMDVAGLLAGTPTDEEVRAAHQRALAHANLFRTAIAARITKAIPALTHVMPKGRPAEWSVTALMTPPTGHPSTVPVAVRLSADARVEAIVEGMRAASPEQPSQDAIDWLAGAVDDQRRDIASACAGTLTAWERRAGSLFAEGRREAFMGALSLALAKRAPESPMRPTDLDGYLAAALSDAAADFRRGLPRPVASPVPALAHGLLDIPPRRIVFHVGPTNSGKTHDAFVLLAAAASGAYLAPLRLLAMEGHERLRDAGVPTGLLTGEEAVSPEGATHLAQTIETFDPRRRFDVVVVDEAQLLADEARGWAWTRALLGARCSTLVLCGSDLAAPFVARLARITGETVETVRHERKTPLVAAAEPVSHEDVRPGDALIAFSRKEVYAHREALTRLGVGVAVVYGGLSPEVRRAEAGRFVSGRADVLVATDAIGMGLNLGPLKRIVFTRTDKFDGKGRRPLTGPEIRQISGRAGRFGHHDAGEVAAMSGPDLDRVRASLDGADAAISDDRLQVAPEADEVVAAARALGTESLVETMAHLASAYGADPGSAFRPAPLAETMAIAEAIDMLPMPVMDKIAFSRCPVEARDPDALWRLRIMATAHAEGNGVAIPYVEPRIPAELHEATVRMMTAYLWLSQRFPATFTQVAEATERRANANKRIELDLRETAARKFEARPRAATERLARFGIKPRQPKAATGDLTGTPQ